MKNLLRLGQFLFVLILLLIAGSVARSSVSDKLTIFTFSQPVELPGVTLPAGTYAFKLLDSIADRSIVQVFDKDQRKLFATILAIPDYTPQASNKTIIKFSETTPGGPRPSRNGSTREKPSAGNSSIQRNAPWSWQRPRISPSHRCPTI
jgi:hypothetical protein